MEPGSWERPPHGDDAMTDKRTPFERLVDVNTVGGNMYKTIFEVKKERPHLDFELYGVTRRVAEAVKKIKEEGPAIFEKGGTEAFNEFVDNLSINGPVFESLYRAKREAREREKRSDEHLPSSDAHFESVSRAIAKGFREIKDNAQKAFEMKEENQ